MCWRAVQNKIQVILDAVKADKYHIYLSSQDEPTWRYEYATILPYKGQRQSEKPKHWKKIRYMLEKTYPTIVAKGIEADDAMSIQQYTDYYLTKKTYPEDSDSFQEMCDTVICSRDKDLLMVPGWHYGWESGNQKEQSIWFQKELNGLKCFYKQLVTGDTVDNILGLYRVGAKSTLCQKIDKCTSEQDMYEIVFKAYQDRFGSYAEDFLVENGRLLWMQRTEEERWLPPKITD